MVDSVKVCQNSGGTLKTSLKRKEREGKPGRQETLLPAPPLTPPAPST